jgi:hypothetical protein
MRLRDLVQAVAGWCFMQQGKGGSQLHPRHPLGALKQYRRLEQRGKRRMEGHSPALRRRTSIFGSLYELLCDNDAAWMSDPYRTVHGRLGNTSSQ